jgi:hypothetical protein
MYVGIGEQVPGDHQDRPAEGDDGAFGSAAAYVARLR